MLKTGLIVTGLLIFITLVGFVITQNSQGLNLSAQISPTPLPSPSSPAPSISTASATPTPTLTSNIFLKTPTQGATVNRMFTISGEARVFENVLQVRVVNKRTNSVIVNQSVMANSPDTGQYGPYSYQVNLASGSAQSGDQLTVEAFQYSAKDGSEIDKTSVLVNFRE